MEGGPYSPLHLSAVSRGCGVGSYMLEALCPPDSPLPLPLLLPPPPFSITAAATCLVDCYDAVTTAVWQRGMYSIAVEVDTMLPVGFV